jgi:hypothetical protein
MIIKKIFSIQEAIILLREKFKIEAEYTAEIQMLTDGVNPEKVQPCLVFVKNEDWEG